MNTPKISIVAAIGKNRELGKNNQLLWHIGDDLKHFKEITSGHAVVMGRKTYDSIGRPLPNRTNIIVSRSTDLHIKDLIIVKSVDEALKEAGKYEKEEVMVIGGGQIFEQTIERADRLYLTIVDKEFEADVFFPVYKEFKRVLSKDERESEGYRYSFLTLEK